MKHMLAIITTKYAGPTDSRGSRIVVTIRLKQDGSTHRRTLPWLHQYGIHDNHQSAAKQALNGLPYPGGLHMDDVEVDGWTHDGAGHWVATIKAGAVPSAGVTLTQAEAADHLDIIEQVAGYALEGWADALERPEFDAWAKRYDDARHRLGATGNTTWFAE